MPDRSINGSAATEQDSWRTVLPPHLAHLQWIEQLVLHQCTLLLQGGLPKAWGAPRAFPRLKRLMLRARSLLGAPLPDIHPGALPMLEELRLQFADAHSTLPASWGGGPSVLPALQTLDIQIQVTSQLPGEAWAAGFQQLRGLYLTSVPLACGTPTEHKSWGPAVTRGGGELQGPPRPAAVPPAAARLPPVALRLPAAWAVGFPKLETLELSHLGLEGSIPPEWVAGGFPALSSLWLGDNALTGTLPRQLLRAHPALENLALSMTQFSGPLPDEWAESQIETLYLGSSRFTGPAFPPSWLVPGALPALEVLDLHGSPGLGGTLPADLPWPKIAFMVLVDTAVTGSIPGSWCKAPFASELRHLNINLTAIDPAFPACFAHSIPTLSVGGGPHAAQTPTASPRQLPAMLLALAAGALVCSGTAGIVLWRRKQRQHKQRLGGQRDAMPLMVLTNSAGSGGAQYDEEVICSPLANSVAACSRRQRLAALLADEKDGIEMLPLHALPLAFAHQLGSARQRAGTTPGGQPYSDASPSLANSCKLLPHITEGDGSTCAPASACCSGRHWGLDTTSLQLSRGELQFDTDDAGQPVVLGEGATAVVCAGRVQGIRAAVKVIELYPETNSDAVWREARLLHDCKHPRILPLYGVAVKGPLVMLAMELMRGGSLRAALQDERTVPQLRWGARGHRVAVDVAEGLDYLHSKQVMHSDIKSGNVLLSGDLRACIADLGLAQVMAHSACHAAGFSHRYAAPEQLMGGRCTLASDVFNFGVLLVELTTLTSRSVRGIMRMPQSPQDCPQAVVELIEECMAANPLRRPSAAEALRRLTA